MKPRSADNLKLHSLTLVATSVSEWSVLFPAYCVLL